MENNIKVVQTEVQHASNVKSKPTLHWIDVTVPDQANVERLDFLHFRNHYTAWITIKQKFKSTSNHEKNTSESVYDSKDEEATKGKRIVTVLKKYRLMQYPHYEGDAQDFHTICLSENFDLEQFDLSYRPLKFRIYLYQPSPNWQNFTIRDISFSSASTSESNRSVSTNVPPSQRKALASSNTTYSNTSESFSRTDGIRKNDTLAKRNDLETSLGNFAQLYNLQNSLVTQSTVVAREKAKNHRPQDALRVFKAPIMTVTLPTWHPSRKEKKAVPKHFNYK